MEGLVLSLLNSVRQQILTEHCVTGVDIRVNNMSKTELGIWALVLRTTRGV